MWYNIFVLCNKFKQFSRIKRMNFTPTLRFAVMSDFHYSKDNPEYRERFAKAMEALYKYSKSESYPFLDALYVVGDFTERGTTEEMQMFCDDCKAYVKSETLVAITLANHELHYMPDYNKALSDFKEIFNMAPDRHEVIKGYHFISLSTIRDKGPWDDSFNDEKRAFLKKELEKARADTKNKPIFVFRHPGIPETILGGVGGNTDVYPILSEYPQVIDFSGHSHNPVNDPREINQKNITTIGTGSMSYICSGGWSDFHIENRRLGRGCAHFRVVEADDSGNVRIRGVDAISGNFFENDAFISDCHDKSKHKYTSRRALDATPPYFDKQARVTAQICDRKLKISFPRAFSERERVKEYDIRFFDQNGVAMGQKNIYSDFMFYKQADTVSAEFDWAYDFMPVIKVYACGFWENISECIVFPDNQ